MEGDFQPPDVWCVRPETVRSYNMITVTYSTLKNAKTLKSGTVLAAGSKLVNGVILNQDGPELVKIKTDAVDNAVLAHAKARRNGVKGKDLAPYAKAVKEAEAAVLGVKFSASELWIIVQGAHSVKLSPAEKGVLAAALKGLTPDDVKG